VRFLPIFEALRIGVVALYLPILTEAIIHENKYD